MENIEIVRRWLLLFMDRQDADRLMPQLDLNYLSSYLTHQEEKTNTIRDQWGNWDAQYCTADHRHPFLDKYLVEKMKQSGIVKRSIWPDNKPLAVIFSHDIDVVSECDPAVVSRKFKKLGHASAGRLNKMFWKLQELLQQMKLLKGQPSSDPLWKYERWIDEAKSRGFVNSFFVFVHPGAADFDLLDCDFLPTDMMMYRGERMQVADFIRCLAKEGAEIGLHGAMNTWKDEVLFAKVKSQLEGIAGLPITATRQHYLHYDISVTPEVHRKAGIQIDSTLGFNRSVGYRAGTAMPYFLNGDVLEVPQIIMDGGLFKDNSCEFDFEYATRYIRSALNDAVNSGGCVVFNFHPNYLNIPLYWQTYLFALEEAKKVNAWPARFDAVRDRVQMFLS